ncbi:hypothetical protein [Bifidobacterium vespertilionis]|uniref:hypothetical protein n=1 Tax=Bifidobacterium vespertilionis TaxID=2562524 RepID=UPI001BDCD8BC|nr:hypothetical protein [Bifidobacterium vespertilionis]MBT1178212.1 hypothetical protein [Bifidobacterium vespertilionis]
MKHIGKALVALVAAIGMAVSGGVATANADDYPTASASNVRVSEIGVHTANVTFDWKVNAPVDQIKSICPVAIISRITDVTPIENRHVGYGSSGFYDYDCSSGILDPDLNSDPNSNLYDQIYGVHEYDLDLPTAINGDEYYTAAKYTAQNFWRYRNGAWDGKSNSGTFSLPIIGLTPNTTYGNTEQWGPEDTWTWVANKFENLWNQGVRTKTPVDMRQAYVGVHVELKNGDALWLGDTSEAAKIPDFKTTSEPAGTPESALSDATKDKVSVEGGKVEAGKSARVYINSLKDACKGDKSCFWYGYVYSEPAKLTGPDGSPFLTVQKDDAGKYYVDVLVPQDLSGEHRIALTDETGALQGWTTVSVGEAKSIPVYRLYNPGMPQAAQHLYTTSKAEYDRLVANDGWQGEGPVFYTAPGETSKPVYRLYNKYTSAHFYTTDADEYNRLKGSWNDEGVAWYVAADADTDVYRLYNHVSGEHLYTTNAAERDSLTAGEHPDWEYEKVEYKVYAQAK